jgi:predicted aspartyl protease
MQKLQVVLAIVGISLLQSLFQASLVTEALAQDESACYMVSAKGKVVDLTGICGSGRQPTPLAPASTRNNSSGVFQTRIKRRYRGIPVIDVVFNGRNGAQVYEMIVDTGASGTAITLPMAQYLGVTPVGVANVDTASQRGVKVPLGYVNHIEVNGAIAQNVLVTIQPALDIGLLGHDFFGKYDVSVKRDVVEFRTP